MLSILLSSIVLSSIGLVSFEQSFAQREEDDDDVHNSNNNVIGQDDDGNEASQSDETSQSSNQNSICVSGESVSLSCNNLSSELSGVGIPGEQGPAGPPSAPPSLAGNVYLVIGNPVNAPPYEVSTASCKEGDTLVSGYGSGGVKSPDSAIGEILNQASLAENQFVYSITPAGNIDDQGATYFASAICFDNP